MKRRLFCQGALLLPAALATDVKSANMPKKSKKQVSEPKQLRHEFFSKNRLQDLWFEIDPADWRRLCSNYLENDYYPCAFVWNGVRFDGAAMRSRGSTSRNPDKPSLRIDMDHITGKSSFRKVKSFLLNNSIEDPSFLKDFLAMQVFRHVGIPSPRRTFSRIYINGKYWGLYSLGEETDKSFRKRKLKDRGGYLYRSNAKGQFFFESGDETAEASAEIFHCLNHPKKPKLGRLSSMLQRINSVPSEDFAVAIGQQLDWKHFMRYMASEAFIDERRGLFSKDGADGFYLYRFKSNGMIWLLPQNKTQSFFSADQSVYRNADANVLTRRALADPSLRQLYAYSLALVATTVGAADGWLDQMAHSCYMAIRDAALEDPNKRCSNSEYEAAAGQVMDFICRRAPLVMEQIGEYGNGGE
jgi:spore coat protein CotH